MDTPICKAKKSYESGDLKTAVKLIKKILQKDPLDYEALVLYGWAALQSSLSKHESPKAFKAAIKVNNNGIEAWRGLVQCLEVEGKYEELVESYYQWLGLVSDHSEWGENIEKIFKYYNKNEEFDVLSLFCKMVKETDHKKGLKLCEIIIKIITKMGAVPVRNKLIVKEALKTCIVSGFFINRDEGKQILNTYLNSQEFDTLGELVTTIVLNDVNFLSKPFLVDIIAVLFKFNYYYHYQKLLKILSAHLLSYCLTFRQQNRNIRLVLLARSMQEQKFTDARNFLIERKGSANWKREAEWVFCRTLYTTFYHLLSYDKITKQIVMEKYEKKFLYEAASMVLRILAKTNDEKCLCTSQRICCKLLKSHPGNVDFSLTLCYSYVGTGQFNKFRKMYNALQTKKHLTNELNFLYAMTLPIIKAVKFIKTVPPFWMSTLYLGLLYAKTGFNECARPIIIKASYMAPFIHIPYDWQARYFWNKKEWSLAFSALNESQELQPYRWTNLDMITDLLLKNENYALDAINMLERCRKSDIKKSYISMLASLKIANYFRCNKRKKDLYHKEADNLRHCIDCNGSNRLYKYFLADSLIPHGRYMTARVVYEKITIKDKNTLIPFALAARIQKGKKNIILYFRESRLLHNKLSIKSILTLYNLAHSSLCNSKFFRKKNKKVWANKYTQLSIDYCFRVLSINVNFASAWKLLGDALINFVRSKVQFLTLPSWIVGTDKLKKLVQINRSNVIQLAIRCYYIALKLNTDDKKWNHLFWHDIGVSFKFLSDICNVKKKIFMKLAYLAVIKAINMYNKKWNYWNTLGIIASSRLIKRYVFAEKVFMKTISLSIHSFVLGYINLGCFYLKVNDYYNAYIAFMRARNMKPSCILPWIGLVLSSNLSEGYDFGEPLPTEEFVMSCLKHIHFSEKLTRETKLNFQLVSLSFDGDFGVQKYPTLSSVINFGMRLEKSNKFVEAQNVYLKVLYNVSVNSKILSNDDTAICSASNIEFVEREPSSWSAYHLSRLTGMIGAKLLFTLMEKDRSEDLVLDWGKAFIFYKVQSYGMAYSKLLHLHRQISQLNWDTLYPRIHLYFCIASVLHKIREWSKIKCLLYNSLFLGVNKIHYIFITYKYTSMYKDFNFIKFTDKKWLQFIRQRKSIERKNRKRTYSVFNLMRAHSYENLDICMCNVINKLLYTVNNLRCKCKWAVIHALFYAYYKQKNYSVAYYFLLKMLKLRQFPKTLNQELLIGCFLALQFNDTSFISRAIHLYPNDMNIWGFFLLSSKKNSRMLRRKEYLKCLQELLMKA